MNVPDSVLNAVKRMQSKWPLEFSQAADIAKEDLPDRYLDDLETLADWAVDTIDAMLREREKGGLDG